MSHAAAEAAERIEMSLAERAKTWKKALRENGCGPLVMAAEVVGICRSWKDYEAEADGLSASGWLRRELGFGLAWFEVRARAVDALGEAIRRTIHHEVAVYVLQSVPEGHRATVVEALMGARLKNGGVPLTKAKALRIIKEIVGRSERRRSCARCLELEARIAILERRAANAS